MKKKLFLFVAAMCCLTTSMWGVTLKTETITCNGNPTVTGASTIMVMGTALSGNDWSVSGGKVLVVKASNFAVTKIVVTGSNVNSLKCTCTNPDTSTSPEFTKSGTTWNQNGYENTSMITFMSSSTDVTVSSLTITYHKHGGQDCVVTHHEAKDATCTEDGNDEYWECDCGQLFRDHACMTKFEGRQVIPATGHKLEFREHKFPDCYEDGNVEHWHCTQCNKNFNEETCETEMLAGVVIPAEHQGKIFVEREEPNCTEAGTKEHWHCTKCNDDFADANFTEKIDPSTLVIPAEHQSKKHKDATDPTCTEDGNWEYWYCDACMSYYSDCDYSQETALKDVVRPALGHDFKSVAHKNPTLVSEGTLSHQHCERCGKNYTDRGVEMDGVTIPRWEADALTVASSSIDDSYLAEEGTVTFTDENTLRLTIGENSNSYTLSETEPIVIDFGHTFKLKANQDPDHTENFYTTFYTSEGAYKVPETANAYIGEVDDNVLNMTNVGGIIHTSEAVIIKAAGNEIILLPSTNKEAASTGNALIGTDEAKTLGVYDYALSLGQNGVGFYLWTTKSIGANKAYLHLEESDAKTLTFEFDDGTVTGINNVSATSKNEGIYNLNGQKVNTLVSKQIYIKNGKKFIAK
ncbi:MAG: hypothetical protein Q4F34_05440 [Prevotellaceae bacterium]|nr:hypothetical protein [Prevotellaceae bacterium]